MQTVAIGGLIGAGKTTAITAAAEALQAARPKTQVVAVFEPVDEWVRSGKLAEFYSAPDEHALAFQKYVLQTRVDAIVAAAAALDPNKPAVLLLDRGLDDDSGFARANHALGNLTAAELEAYEAALAAAKDDVPLAARCPLRLWLEVPPAVCAERCAHRARDAESAVSIDYLNCLDRFRPVVDDCIDGTAGPTVVAAALVARIEQWLGSEKTRSPVCK